MPKSCDVGTCNIVSACQADNNEIKLKSIRDAFLDVENEPTIRSMLSKSGVNYIEDGDKLYILGDSAVIMANIFKREARRPMSKGVISPGETIAEKILLILLEHVLEKAKTQNDLCYYSVPATPCDRDMDIVYHQAMFSKLIGSLGYKPVALVEGAAISYSNASKENFSSLSISLGSGMVNVCLMYQTMIGMAFSLSRCGDFVDESAARATGTTASRIQSIKERGIDLTDATIGDPKMLREREAIIIYYKSLILYVLDSIRKEFKKRQVVDLPNAIPCIIGGGTCLPKNFLEFFIQALNTFKDFPILLSETRLAKDPLNCVAQGLLVAALNDDSQKK